MEISTEFFNQFADLVAEHVVERLRTAPLQLDKAASVPTGGHGSRNARLFPETKVTKTPEGEESCPAINVERDAVKGFLYVCCPKCGNASTTFAKKPQYGVFCSQCNTDIALRLSKLKIAHVRCTSCGNYIKYNTNADPETRMNIEIPCKSCGAPVDLEWNHAKHAYVTLE